MKILILIFSLGFSFNIRADLISNVVNAFGEKQDAPGAVIFESVIEAKKRKFDALKKEEEAFSERKEKFLKDLKPEVDLINNQINSLKKELKNASSEEQEFINNKIALLNENYQDLLDSQIYIKKIHTNIEQQIKLLEEYLNDPGFKGIKLEQRAFYTFEDLKNINKIIDEQKARLKHFQEQQNNQKVDLEKQKLNYSNVVKEYEMLQKEQEMFTADTKEGDDLSINQKGELLDLKKKTIKSKKRLLELKLEEANYNIALLEENIFIVESKIKILTKELEKIKNRLRVDISSLERAQNEFSAKRQEFILAKEKYYQEIESLSGLKDKSKKELTEIIELNKEKFPDIEKLDESEEEPKTVEGYLIYSHIIFLKNHTAMLNKKIELAEASITLENAKFNESKLIVDTMETLHKITLHKFKTNEEINKEIKKYIAPKSVASVDLASIKEKRNTATNYLNILNKNLDKIRTRIEELKSQKDILFKNKFKEYNRTLIFLNRSEKQVAVQVEVNGKLIEIYSNLISVLTNTINQIVFISGELEKIGIWHRSIHAISVEGFRNIIPDLHAFWQDYLKVGAAYIANFNTRVMLWIKNLAAQPLDTFILLVKILLIFLLFIILKIILGKLSDICNSIKTYSYSLSVFFKLCLAVISFIELHYNILFIWFLLLVFVLFDIISNVFLDISFFLLSIIYLIFLFKKFIDFIIAFNAKNDYFLFGRAFKRRFLIVFSIFAYSTIIILLFREAFILGIYTKSEFPTILLAFYSIILRFLVIFAIGKEDILNIIPKRSNFWRLIWNLINRYYYLILVLIALIMIIGDPYVGGFGNLVYFLLTGFAGTVFLVWLLFIIHNFLRIISSRLFFYTDDEISKERFSYAKTWYGLSVIVSFVFMVLFGIIVGGWIWGKPIKFNDLMNILNYHLFYGDINPINKAPINITMISLLKLWGFLLSGVFVVFIVKRYILKSIFDLLLVDSGIQNAVYSIVRYFIIITALVLGFKEVGLSSFIVYVAVLIAGIGFAVKEPISDLISYFIILIQRPIKIGDYIQIDETTMGVVRKIAPRSVILRRKNSYMIVVPNSRILNGPIANWNYTRSFAAFNDIIVTVSYKNDPAEARKIILDVLDKNNNVLKNPQPIVRLNNFLDHGYQILIRGFVSSNNILNIWEIASQIRFDIVKEFREKGILIAFPIREIKIINE